MGKVITLIVFLIGFLVNGILFIYTGIRGGETNDLIVSGIWMLLFYNACYFFMLNEGKK